MNKRVAAFAALGFLAVSLAGCSGAESELKTECRQAVADHTGVALEDVEITKEGKSPAGSIDWRGVYADGEFACAATLDSARLEQVVVYPTGGVAETVSIG